MHVVLSGFAGVGKSSIIEKTHREYKNVFICPESAREVNYTKDFYDLRNDTNNEFFQKSVMDNEIMKVMTTRINRINNVIYDRCILDNFAFAEIFYGSDRVNYNKFDKFIVETKERFELEYLYDYIFFINSTENEDFIAKSILNDPFRQATTSSDVKEWIKKSKEWEKIYFELFYRMDGVAKAVKRIDHFIDSSKYNFEVEQLLESAFKI